MRRILDSLGVAVLFVTSTALAEEGAPRRSVSFEVTAPCTDAWRFAHEVLGRTTRARLATGDEGWLFRVEIIDESGSSKGRLTMARPDAPATDRSLVGTSCDEVATALALVSALAIDPEARAEIPRVPIEPPPKPVDPKPPAPRPAPVFYPSPDDRESVTEGRTGFRFGAVAETSLFSGLLQHGLGLGVAVDLMAESPSALAPSFRFAFVQTFGATQGDVPVEAIATLGRVEGCPLRGDFGPIWVLPCVGIFVGGTDVTVPTTLLSEFHPTVGGLLLGRAVLAAGHPFSLDLSLGVDIPFTRKSFVYDVIGETARTSAVAPYGALGIGVSVP